MDDMTANLLLEYGIINNEQVVAAEVKRVTQRSKIREMSDRLSGIDPDLDDLLKALLAIHHEEDLEAPVDANILIVYGVIDGEIVKAHEKRRLEMVYLTERMRTMDMNIDNLLEAIQKLREDFKKA